MAVESLDDELPINGNLSEESSQNHTRPYYAKYQGYEFRHKTNSEVYAHHWGELKDLILFPGHLPELYLPTNESFNSTMPRAEHNTIISQCISLIQSRNSDKLWIVAYAVGYSIIAFLLFNVTFDLWKAGYRWSTVLPVIIPVLVFFSPLLLLRDEKRRSQYKLHRNFAITSIILITALAGSIYLIVDFIEHVFSEVDSGDAEKRLENGFSAIKTWEGLQSLAGASVVLYFASLYREYKICSNKWVETLAPEWKLYNKEKIFKDWMRGYHSFIEERNIDHDFSIAVSRLIHIYSMKRHTFMTPNGENKDYLLEQWDGEDGNEKTKTFEAIDAFKTQLADLRIKLPDALLSLDQEDRLEYMRFNSLSDLDFNNILARASKIRYENHLKSKLIENTYVVENPEIRKKWEEVILSTELNERFLAENNSNEKEDIEAWFSNFLQASENKPTAIFAQSGAGKTTTLLHICLASLQNKNAPCPLFVKAREISNMKIFSGDLSLEELVQDRGYLSYWQSAKNKLLVIDGLDENPIGRHYAEHLHKSLTFYGAKLILSSRFNLKYNLRNFDQLELVDMSVTFKDKLVHSTSEIAEQRRMVSKNVFNRPDAQAASIFAIAELLKLSDEEEDEVNLSTHSIAKWRFETLCKEKKRKLGGRIRYSQLAAAIGAYIVESYFNMINAESLPGKDEAFDWGIIDEDGLLDDDHVGYCLSQYMGYVLNLNEGDKSRDEKIARIIQLWISEFEDEDEKWFDEISRCMITAGHNFDLGRVLVGIGDDDNRDDIISELIKIASEEWNNGDYPTKKNIVSEFLGFDHIEESSGRIVYSSEKHKPEWIVDDLDSRIWLNSVIDFHCESWENEDDTWNELEDATWSYLTSRFIGEVIEADVEKLNLLTNRPEGNLVDGEKEQQQFTITNSLEAQPHIHEILGNPKMNTPLTSALLDERMMRIETAFNSAIIPENMAEQSRTMQTQITAWKELDLSNTTADELTQFWKKVIQLVRELNINDPYLNYDKMKRWLLFGGPATSQLIPLNKTKEKTDKLLTKLPVSLQNLIYTHLDLVATSEEAEAIRLLQQLHVYINMVSYSHNREVFTITYEEGLYGKFSTCINTWKTSDADSNFPERIARLYGLLRNHTGNYNPENFSKPLREKAQHVSNYISDDSETDTVELLPLSEQGLDDTKIQIQRFGWSVFEKQADYVNWKITNYFDKLYSVVPLEYLNDYQRRALVKRPKNRTKQTEWGVILEPSNTRLLEILNNQSEKENYANLMRFIPWLKLEGKYSNLNQTKSMASAYSVDLERHYFGICVTKRGAKYGPDENGRFHVHLISGTRGNDIYVSKNTSPESFEFLESLSLMAESSDCIINEIYLKMKFTLKDIISTGHSVLAPIEMIQVCRGCLNELTEHVSSQIHSICLECEEECVPPKLFPIHGANYSLLFDCLNDVYDIRQMKLIHSVYYSENRLCVFMKQEDTAGRLVGRNGIYAKELYNTLQKNGLPTKEWAIFKTAIEYSGPNEQELISVLLNVRGGWEFDYITKINVDPSAFIIEINTLLATDGYQPLIHDYEEIESSLKGIFPGFRILINGATRLKASRSNIKLPPGFKRNRRSRTFNNEASGPFELKKDEEE